jgi:hypothetical protein
MRRRRRRTALRAPAAKWVWWSATVRDADAPDSADATNAASGADAPSGAGSAVSTIVGDHYHSRANLFPIGDDDCRERDRHLASDRR